MSQSPSPRFARVLLDEALDRELDYAIPHPLVGSLLPGSRVIAPLRGAPKKGYVLTLHNDPPAGLALKELLAASPPDEGLPAELLSLAQWIAQYYCTPLQKVLRSILPGGVRRQQGVEEQLYALRNKPLAQLADAAAALRNNAPAQARLLDILLKEREEIALSELLKGANATHSAASALAKKGLIKLEKRVKDRSPLLEQEFLQIPPKQLNGQQQQALDAITEALQRDTYGAFLLHGITGSGKTEVYLQAMQQALAAGKTAIFMVPEIALTTQMIERLRSRFHEKMVVLHSRLSDGERHDAWHALRRGDIRIAIGARSAVFSPLPNLGLLILDEEHDSSYKQSEKAPCYHAREVAVMRAFYGNATVVLGSATPSLESYYNCQKGKYTLLKLTERADRATLPTVQIVDMQRERDKAQGWTLFSQPLLDGIQQRMAKGEQTILFLNRRGYHTMLLCQGCGASIKCRHCDSTMTFHRGEEVLACHLCGYVIAPPPRRCPACGEESTMKFRGVGTEQVERCLHAIFPEVRTLRIDADTTKRKGSHEKLLRHFASGKADVLVGTQMVSKGLHFPEVTLVGVLNADSSLHIPDYRAAEVTFQQLTQVAGRAGRGVVPGHVLIQTMMPEHPTIVQAASQAYEPFFATEMTARQAFGFPPYTSLVKVSASGPDEQAVQGLLNAIRQAMRQALPAPYQLLPVGAAAHVKVKDRFRYHFLARGPASTPIAQAYQQARQRQRTPRDTFLSVDVNPLSTFF